MFLGVIFNWVKQNPTPAIAFLSLLLSLYNFSIDLFEKRKNFRIQVHEIKSYADVTFLYVGIENRSRLSIAITQVSLLLGVHSVCCTAKPTLVAEIATRSGNKITNQEQTFSTPLPITVPGLGAQSAVILFEALPELPADDATHLTVQVCTNRGRAKKMKLELPQEWASRRKALL